MIDNLTQEQTAKFPSYVTKWLDIGLNTEPADFEASKKYICEAYKIAGVEPPSDDRFFHAPSPMAAIEMVQKISEGTIKKSDCLSNLCYGSLDANWLSLYDYFLTECNLEFCNKLDPFFKLSKSCGWWLPYSDFVVMSDKPREIHMNADKVLHNDSGMSVLYSDGFGIWSINGIAVTEQIVMSPETLTVDQIDAESNGDVRSIMLDRFTWVRYIKEGKCSYLDGRRNLIEGTMETLYKTPYDHRLIVTCPTGRMFSLGVPDSVKDCVNAQSWLAAGRKLNVIGRT